MENHSVQIDNREKMTITDIREIDSFDEEEIRASLRQGAMVIRGEDLHIHMLDLTGRDSSDHRRDPLPHVCEGQGKKAIVDFWQN